MILVRDLRSEAARALPRPSARASAKVAKSTVSQRKSVTEPVNQTGSSAAARKRHDEGDQGDGAGYFHRKHDRIAPEGTRIQFFQGIHQGSPKEFTGKNRWRWLPVYVT